MRAWYSSPDVIKAYEFAALRRITERDGSMLILTGGQDIYPGLYNQPITHARWWNPERDLAEVTSYIAARCIGMPVLGICRGHQLMAALNGGSLYQDLELDAGVQHHDYTHELHITSDIVDMSWLPTRKTAAGTAVVYCNSLHHQTVRDVPSNGTVVARAPDDTVEAIFYPGIGLGVQWHPESMNTPGVVDATLSARAVRATSAELTQLMHKLRILREIAG